MSTPGETTVMSLYHCKYFGRLTRHFGRVRRPKSVLLVISEHVVFYNRTCSVQSSKYIGVRMFYSLTLAF